MHDILIQQIDKKIKELGLSYSVLERRLGFGNGSIKRFSISSPSIERVMLISEFFNVSLDWLVYGSNKNFLNLTEKEAAFLSILRSLKSEEEQSRLIGYVEGYIRGISSYSYIECNSKHEALNE